MTTCQQLALVSNLSATCQQVRLWRMVQTVVANGLTALSPLWSVIRLNISSRCKILFSEEDDDDDDDVFE
eukprot:5276134-Pyramimonas_sp.AAC.2